MGPQALVEDQPRFLNAMVAARSSLEPEALLRELKRIEAELGRRRRQRYGPREIDLDLIAYGEVALESETLSLPHPRASERGFVSVAAAAPESRLRLGRSRSRWPTSCDGSGGSVRASRLATS
mmetsp:Transcript_11602/g.36914  ORF Transcript_11602/g.36914 Transcript_11602/m.36914 type:complete len:123 (+) Transcript_11602:224-592(+)